MDQFTKEEIAWLKKTKPQAQRSAEEEIPQREGEYIKLGLSNEEALERAMFDFSHFRILEWA